MASMAYTKLVMLSAAMIYVAVNLGVMNGG
jgi:hypothetical protein